MWLFFNEEVETVRQKHQTPDTQTSHITQLYKPILASLSTIETNSRVDRRKENLKSVIKANIKQSLRNGRI